LRENKILANHLDLAVANIMRLTLEIHQLRRELEATSNITRIGPAADRLSNGLDQTD
jgi:hypothetical protein